MKKNAFVTGSTGFLGLNLIELLVNEGWKVTALHRFSSDLTYLKRFNVTLVEGAVTDRASLEEGLPDGTEVVFHLAGDTNMWSKKNAAQTATNIEGTKNLLEVAKEKGVKKFIHTSSIAAWGFVYGTITEETPQKGKSSWVNYEKSKWAGEQEAFKAMSEKMEIVVLNPVVVVGRYDTNNWGKMFFSLRDNEMPGIPTGEIEIANCREVASAHLAAVEKGRNGERYILGGERCSMPEFISEISRLMGIKKQPKAIPTVILKFLAHLPVLIASITGKEPNITPEMISWMTRKGVTFSDNKAISELEYKPTSAKEAIKDCYDWLLKEGLL